MTGIERERAAPRPVILTVKGRQAYDGAEPDETELMTEGAMTVTKEGCRLSYEETALSGMEGTTTTFEVSGPRVILTRAGRVNSQLVFEEGRQHTSLYETPFGALTLDVRTSRLRHNLTERGGVLEIQYSVAVGYSATGHNRFLLRVRPVTFS